MRLALVRIDIALLVCLKSASTAVFIAVSLSATRSTGESDLAMMVEESFILISYSWLEKNVEKVIYTGAWLSVLVHYSIALTESS